MNLPNPRLATELERMTLALLDAGEWLPYPTFKPVYYGRFEVYRANCSKQHYATYNGTGWAYDNTSITHFRKIISPLE